MATRRRIPKQLELPKTGGWGGRRKGAGRKPAGTARSGVAHVARPAHAARNPVHVTLRARYGLPSFRQQVIHRIFATVLGNQRKRAYKDVFRVVHFSIQASHLHLVVEADAGASAIRAGVSGLAIAFARRLNELLRRKGSVWADRYHRHDLVTPREVHHALAYLFDNFTHHGEWSYGEGVLDLHASGWMFHGWREPPMELPPSELWRWPVCRPRTWLVRKGYAKHGPLVMRRRHP